MLIGRYPALLDRTALKCAFVRGALLFFGDERLLQPHWTAAALNACGIADEATLMAAAFPAGEIIGFEPFVEALTQLPGDEERQTLAAAIVGKCSGIVTTNVQGFPIATTDALHIEVVHPDDFIVNIVDLDPGRALEACRRHREAMQAGSAIDISATEFLAKYEAAGLIQAHGRLKSHVGLL